jgi:Na+-driven multidrug efflux pump
MLIMAGGAIFNIILDPIFIFALGLGIKGAAIASTISIFAMALVSVLHFVQPTSFIRFKSHAWKLKGYIFKNITLIGMSPFLMNLAAAGVVGILNSQLLRYGGDYAVGTYGICNTYGNFLVLIIIGVCQGMQPIVGYNYGAEKYDRMLRCLFIAIACATSILLVGWALSMLFPMQIARIFTADETLMKLAARGIVLDMLVFFVVGTQAVITNFFQCIGKVKISIFLSLSRQLFMLLPMAFVFPMFWQLDGVWYAMPASDFCSFSMTLPILWWYMKKFKEKSK